MKYRVEGGVAEIGADMLLRLSEEQIAARRHALEPVDQGKFWRPLQVLQFKVGEEIDLDRKPEQLPRSLAIVLVPAGRRGKAPRAKSSRADPAMAGETDGAEDDEEDQEDQEDQAGDSDPGAAGSDDADTAGEG